MISKASPTAWKFHNSILFLEKTHPTNVNEWWINNSLQGKLALINFYNTAMEPVGDGILNW